MSKPGALSKKELAEAGRRKLEEFKRKKQQKTRDAEPGASESASSSSLTVASAPAAQAADAVSKPAAAAAASGEPWTAAPGGASGAPSASAAPLVQQAVSSASQATVQQVPYIPGLSSSSGDAASQSTAARAAAAGAAAAALEAALMGLPPADKPPFAATSSEAPPAATTVSQALTPANLLIKADKTGPLPPAPLTQQDPSQLQQFPPPAGINSPRTAAMQQANQHPQQAHAHYEEQPPMQQPWQPSPSLAASATGSTWSTAGPLDHWQQEGQGPGTPEADPASAPGNGSFTQRSGWLSLFGGRGSSQQTSGYQEQQDMQQHQVGQLQVARPVGGQQAQQQQQQSQFDSLLLYHHSGHSRQPSSPGHKPIPLIPPAGPVLPAAAGLGRPPVHWMPGAAASTAEQTPATGFHRQPWIPGMRAGGTHSAVAGQGTAAAGGQTPVYNYYSSTSTPQPASAGHLNMSHEALTVAQQQQLPASSSTAAGLVNHDAEHGKPPQQLQSTGAGQGVLQSAAAASGYASLSDSYLGYGAAPESSSRSKQQQSTDNELPVKTAEPETDVSASQRSTKPNNLVHELSFGPGNTVVPPAVEDSSVGHPGSIAVQPGHSDGFGSQQQTVVDEAPGQQQHKHQLPSGSISRPDSYSSFVSLGAASGAARSGLLMNGVQAKAPASGAGAGGSIASGSAAGSGPPSTSGGFSAMSYIQAHAETSSRNAASLKLLQQHIDELTTEKLELMRGLQQQAKASEALADENRSLGEQQNSMATKLESERQAVKRLQAEIEAAAASLTTLVGQRDALRAAAQEATDRANTLAAENVSLENQLLELKSSTLRLEKESQDATAAAARLEGQLAQLGSSAGQQGQELQGLQAERRILKARLMQAEARMRAAGLEPLPPMPAGMATADAAAAPAKVDAEVQTDLQQQQHYQLPPDTSAPDAAVLEPAAAAIKAAGKQLLDPVVMNQQAAAVLSGLEQWLPQDILAAAEAAIAADTAAREQQAVEGSAAEAASGSAADAGYYSAMAAASSVLVGGVGSDVWCEEARLVSSITGLAAQLEGTWEDMRQQLQQAQALNEDLQQSEANLHEQLADMQKKYDQQQLLLLQQHHPQQQRQQQQHSTFVAAANTAEAETQRGLGAAYEQLHHQVQQHQQRYDLQQQQQTIPKLPVSVPAASAAEITAAAVDDPGHLIPDASSPTKLVHSPDSGESHAISANSVVGSTVDSAQLWDDGGTASSRPGGRGWFGVWGKRNQRSALV